MVLHFQGLFPLTCRPRVYAINFADDVDRRHYPSVVWVGGEDTRRCLQPKRNEINKNALLLMQATIPVGRQNQNNKKKSQPNNIVVAILLPSQRSYHFAVTKLKETLKKLRRYTKLNPIYRADASERIRCSIGHSSCSVVEHGLLGVPCKKFSENRPDLDNYLSISSFRFHIFKSWLQVTLFEVIWLNLFLGSFGLSFFKYYFEAK